MRKGMGDGLLQSSSEACLEYAIRFSFRASNNKAEYEV